MKKIALFASGSGSNMENIVSYFRTKSIENKYKIFVNNPIAGVIERAERLNLDTLVFDREALSNGLLSDELEAFSPDLIVLAGFLWKFPSELVEKYKAKIVNIHPALLPKYGGKGMYGMRVHQSVIDNNEIESGITIHYVNENYDEGDVIYQAKTDVVESDTPETLAQKVHQLEYEYFPVIIEKLLLKLQ